MAQVVDAEGRANPAASTDGGLAEEALRLGVRHLYLAVVPNNDAAKALYESSGFRPVHEYRYFTSQPD